VSLLTDLKLPTGAARQEKIATAKKKPRKHNDVLFYLSAGFVALVVLVAFFGRYIAPFDPNAIDFQLINAAPGQDGHLLGTDQNGRDIFSRLLVGARSSMLGALIVTIGSTIMSIIIGAVAGWYGGWVDNLLSRVIDFLFAFPGLLLAVFAVAIFGPGLMAPAIALSVAFIPAAARLIRNAVVQERSKDYVRSLEVLGFGGIVIFLRHVFPNVAAPYLSMQFLCFGYSMVDLAAISFLGLGVQPPTSDWGLMVSEGQSSFLAGTIWPVLWPSAAIVLTVVAINYVGEQLTEKWGGRSHV